MQAIFSPIQPSIFKSVPKQFALGGRTNKFARFNGTTDYASVAPFTIPSAAATVLCRLRTSASPAVPSGPFEVTLQTGPFFYEHASGNCWCGCFRLTWVENFTLDGAIDREDWHWVVIRSDVTNGWEFLQATDTGSLSSRATASHEAFGTTMDYTRIAQNQANNKFAGDIDRLLLIPTRLSNADIQAIIAGGNGTSPKLRYEFTNDDGGVFSDESGNAINATITGTPTIVSA